MPPMTPMVLTPGADDEDPLANASGPPWQKTDVQDAANRTAIASNRRLIENDGHILWDPSGLLPV